MKHWTALGGINEPLWAAFWPPSLNTMLKEAMSTARQFIILVFALQFQLQLTKIIRTKVNNKFNFTKLRFVDINTILQTSLKFPELLNRAEKISKIIKKRPIFHLSPIRYDISKKKHIKNADTPRYRYR